MPKPKVIAILGPTASGKTALSIELAKELNGEVISADSRQVYRGLDIGSGKVTEEEMQGIPHHLISIVDPADSYSGADFVRDASSVIADITARGKVSIIAGGTFFYVDLLRGKQSAAPVPANPTLQAKLELLSTEELVRRLTTTDPRRAATIDTKNRRRLIRALEIIDTLGVVPEADPSESPYDWLIFGIAIEREKLNARIETRLHQRLKDGMEDEVSSLLRGGVSKERLVDFGLEYRYLVRRHYQELTYEQMTEELFAKIRQFAKRQQTWLKRDSEIIWKQFPIETASVVAEARAWLKS
jgi:tRNA dimethylallyltransferase